MGAHLRHECEAPEAFIDHGDKLDLDDLWLL
jgi:hypothetical protein